MFPFTTLPRGAALGRVRWIALAALLTVGCAILLAHEGHSPLPTRGAQVDAQKGHLLLTSDACAAINVETAAVEARSIEERVLAYASIVAPWRSHAFATSRLPGRIVRVSVVPGKVVRAGDTIAEIQSVELDALQLDLLAARNEIALFDKLVAELTRSAEAGAVPGQLVVDATARLAQNRNALELARNRWIGLGLPAEQLAELLAGGKPLPGLTLPVTAPVSGTVAHAELTAGKVIEPSEHLAEIIDLSTVWVRIDVLERDLHRVAVGMPVEILFAAYPSEPIRGMVTARSEYLDPIGNVSSVWVELPNPAGAEPRLRPGMSGQAFLILSDAAIRPASLCAVTGTFGSSTTARGTARLTVPVSAVLREGIERFVLVEESRTARSSEYRKVPVVTGRAADGRVEIVWGQVYEGDRVVTRGAHELGPYFTPTLLTVGPDAGRGIGLTVEPARMISIDQVLTLEGAVDLPPARRGIAASQLAGTIQSIRVDRGQAVAKGEVVAEVFSPELLTMQQEFLRLNLEENLAFDTLARLRKSGAGVASRDVWEIESKLNGHRVQSGTLRRKLETVGLTADPIDRLLADRQPVAAVPVRAPFDGVVVSFEKVLGQAVAAHEALFEIHDATRPPLRGLVAERDAGRVRIGQTVRVRLIADAGFVGTGRVARSSRTIGVESRTQAVWVELDDDRDRPLLHGQLAALTIVIGHRPPALAIPRSAIAGEGAKSFVFVRKPTGDFERRLVETGASDDRYVTVIRGLSEGDVVAASGVPDLMTAFASLK